MSEAIASVVPSPSPPWPRRLASDKWLAERAARGDRRAFAEIFGRHHQAIYRYCRSILRDPEDAADALQNTMAAALRGLEGETREIALKPWLYRIAHNESLSMLRGRRAHLTLEADREPVARGTEVEVLQSERLREVVADVQALPDRQRGALVMRELSGLEYAEIAAAFGIREGAARQAVHEAREMLHEIEQGRAMRCADVRELISAGDRRRLRGRTIRSHLRSCAECHDFEAMIPARRAALAAAAPPLAAPLAATLLQGLLGGTQMGAAGASSAAASAASAGGSGGAAAAGAIGGGPAGSLAGVATIAKVAGTGGVMAKTATVLAVGASLAGGTMAADRALGPDTVRPESSAPEPADRGQRPPPLSSAPSPNSAAPPRAPVERGSEKTGRGRRAAQSADARDGNRRSRPARARRDSESARGRSAQTTERRGGRDREAAARAPGPAARAPSGASQRPATRALRGSREGQGTPPPAPSSHSTAQAPITERRRAAAGRRPQIGSAGRQSEIGSAPAPSPARSPVRKSRDRS